MRSAQMHKRSRFTNIQNLIIKSHSQMQLKLKYVHMYMCMYVYHTINNCDKKKNVVIS